MAKEITKIIKLQINAGAANPSPPVGPALGQAGVNIMAFCKEFNAATQKQAGDLLPTVITVYKDKSFSFITKQPPGSVLLKSRRHRLRLRRTEQKESRHPFQGQADGSCQHQTP